MSPLTFVYYIVVLVVIGNFIDQFVFNYYQLVGLKVVVQLVQIKATKDGVERGRRMSCSPIGWS